MMKLTKLLERLEYKVVQGNDDIEITELTNDSRKVCAGSVFVCISGAVVDGHEFVKEVSEKGAKAVIVEKEVEAPEHVTVIKVEDTRYALALASAAYFGYPAEQLKVIGITGTKGKTTTTYMVKSILEGVGHKVGLIGTIEAIIGDEVIPAKNTTPESFTIHQYFRKMVDAGCDAVVMEVSSQGLMLHRTAGIPFEIGIFTNLGKIISDRMNIKILKIINDAKVCCSNNAGLGLRMWMIRTLKMTARPARLKHLALRKSRPSGKTDTKLVSRPGYLGEAYHVSGLMDFDVRLTFREHSVSIIR